MSKDENIQPHVHLINERNIDKTVEIIFVQKGQLTVTFHESEDKNTILDSVTLKKGDVIIFPSNFMYPHKVEPVTKGTRYYYISWVW